MKRSVKITLIIAAALVGLGACLAAVGFGMGGRLSQLRGLQLDPATGTWRQTETDLAIEDGYTGGELTVPAEGITDLRIDWTAGSVTVLTTDDADVVVTERVARSISEKYAMKITADGTLVISDDSDPLSNVMSNFPERKLTVRLPRSVAENLTTVQLNGVSADFNVGMLTIKENFTFDSTSGNLETDFLTADGASAALNTVSGDVDLAGSFRQVTGSSTSGDYDLVLQSCPAKLDLGTTSGDVEIELPRGTGFTLQYDTVSGELESDFAMKRSGDTSFICGNGGGSIHAETTSGDLLLEYAD